MLQISHNTFTNKGQIQHLFQLYFGFQAIDNFYLVLTKGTFISIFNYKLEASFQYALVKVESSAMWRPD